MPKSKGSSAAEGPEKASSRKAMQAKRRELLELRTRWKVADEAGKRISEERKVLKARIDALVAETKSSPAGKDDDI